MHIIRPSSFFIEGRSHIALPSDDFFERYPDVYGCCR